MRACDGHNQAHASVGGCIRLSSCCLSRDCRPVAAKAGTVAAEGVLEGVLAGLSQLAGNEATPPTAAVQ
jgi:hypothetical protein